MTVKPFVYGLVDPLDAGHVRYVGMSFRAGRPLDHARNARGKMRSSHLMNWIRKLQTEGREYIVLVLEELPLDSRREFVGFVEKCYIKSLREIGHKLTNVTEGGDGGAGNVHTPEVRAQISAAAKGRIVTDEVRARTRATLMGHAVSDETRAKQSAAKSRYFENPENKLKRSESARAAVTDGTRALISASGKGRVVSPETRAKISASMSKLRAQRREDWALDA